MKLLGCVLALLVCPSLCEAGRKTGGPSIGYNCIPPWRVECQRSSTGLLRRDVGLYESLRPSVHHGKMVPTGSTEDSKGLFWKAFSSKEQEGLKSLYAEGQTLFETRDRRIGRRQKSGNGQNALLLMQLQRWMEKNSQRQAQTEKSPLSDASAELADDTAKEGILTGLYNKGKAFLGRYWAPSNLTARSRKMSGLVSRLLKNIADKLKEQKKSELPQDSVVQRLLRMIEY